MSLAQRRKWLQIEFVIINKAKTFDMPDDESVRKSYLVKNDILKVQQISPTGFIQVEYNNPSTPERHFSYWIKEADLNVIPVG